MVANPFAFVTFPMLVTSCAEHASALANSAKPTAKMRFVCDFISPFPPASGEEINNHYQPIEVERPGLEGLQRCF
jgi:hypothetical protein